MEKEKEIIKSIFGLAQIIITISGFFIAASGFSFALRSSLISSAVNLIPDDQLDYSAEVCGGDSTERFLIRNPSTFFWSGIILAIFALAIWGIGFYLIFRFNKK